MVVLMGFIMEIEIDIILLFSLVKFNLKLFVNMFLVLVVKKLFFLLGKSFFKKYLVVILCG